MKDIKHGISNTGKKESSEGEGKKPRTKNIHKRVNQPAAGGSVTDRKIKCLYNCSEQLESTISNTSHVSVGSVLQMNSY